MNSRTWTRIIDLVLLAVVTLPAARWAQAQTFTLLHTFSGAPDGSGPNGALLLDAAGNLYGTTV